MLLSETLKLTLHNVLYIPHMKVSLLSLTTIQENGYTVVFENGNCNISPNSDGACALWAPLVDATLSQVRPLEVLSPQQMETHQGCGMLEWDIPGNHA